MSGEIVVPRAPTDIVRLADVAMKQLAEARTLGDVLLVAAHAEALAAFAKKLDAAKAAQSACIEIVILAEQRIGRELRAAQERGELATRDHGGANIPNGGPGGNSVAPATLTEIGLSKKQAMRAKRLADVPEAAIKAEVAAAQAENRLPQRSRILAAADPTASPAPPKARPKPVKATAAADAIPLRLRRRYADFIPLLAKIAGIDDVRALVAAHDPASIESDLETAHAAGDRLLDMIDALEAVQRAKP